MRNHVTALSFILLFILIFGAANAQQSFYVSPGGDDDNPGTLIRPFATIAKAQRAVRRINSDMRSDIVVYLRGGRYQLSSTLKFDARDSGSNGHRVIYSAYQDEVPVISGGVTIRKWGKGKNGVYTSRSQGTFRQLYVNGRRAIRARTPDAGSYHRLKLWNERDREIIIDSTLIRRWSNFRHVEMIPQLHWAEAILPLESFEKAGPYAHVVPQEPERALIFKRMYPVKSENEAFHFENALEFLDQPGEWYHDPVSKKLYYRPRSGEDMQTAIVIAPELETLIQITGTFDDPVHHLTFTGITFSHAGWNLPRDTGMLSTQAGFYSIRVEGSNVQYFSRPPAAVYVAAAHHLRFERNHFTHLGATGLDLHYGTHDDVIIGNVFEDISGNGMLHARFSGPDEKHTRLYNPDDMRDICANDTISNNIVTRIGRDYPGCCGIACGFPRAVIIEHNDIFDLPYTGISVGWSWMDEDNVMQDNQIRYNHIYNVVTLLCDGGGIYTLSKQPNSMIKENYIHDIYRSQWAVGSLNNGIFLDQGSNGLTLERNVFENIQEGTIRHHDTSTIVSIKNDTQDQRVKDNAGLTPAFHDIRSRLSQLE
ncbi:MAG: right-handed parallel beta-helix repeat-containing protein [candidate division KSB1 bacterium]|nr:right-handed parallel beta-helix repeat-containing protein [candidate division KSB1 bacterium]